MKWGVTKVKHPNKGHTPNKEQKPMYQGVRYLESPLYYINRIYTTINLLTTVEFFFINMKEVFPCVKSLSYRYHPVCKIFTHEEDDFRGERSIYEAADSGNHFHIFNATIDIPTYGFGIQGCAEFTTDCIPTNRQFAIVCYSPY